MRQSLTYEDLFAHSAEQSNKCLKDISSASFDFSLAVL